VHLRVPLAEAVVAAGLDRRTIDLTESARETAGAEPAA
jgi:hypothetical protein